MMMCRNHLLSNERSSIERRNAVVETRHVFSGQWSQGVWIGWSYCRSEIACFPYHRCTLQSHLKNKPPLERLSQLSAARTHSAMLYWNIHHGRSFFDGSKRAFDWVVDSSPIPAEGCEGQLPSEWLLNLCSGFDSLLLSFTERSPTNLRRALH